MKVFATIAALGIALCGVQALMAQTVPKVKSDKEAAAVNAIALATTPDDRIAAVENLVQNYADTEFKSVALQAATDAARDKGDVAKVMIYGERTLEADPKNFDVMLAMANMIASKVRKNDLDKAAQLAKAQKLADDALPLIQQAVKPRPDITDEQWDAAKKDYLAQDYQALGLIQTAAEKYDEAEKDYKAGIAYNSTIAPLMTARLAESYNKAGKLDEAIATCDKLIADAAVSAQIKQFCRGQKDLASQKKAAKSKTP